MALFNRLIGTEEPKIPIHQFQGAMTEWVLTEQDPTFDFVSRADVIAAFSIQPAEEAYLDQLFNWFDFASNVLQFAVVFDNVFLLGERGLLGYDVQANVDARLLAQSNQ